MAAYLPTGIADRKEYFNTTLRFLVRYEWLYNYPVTEILSSGLLDQLPIEWWKVLQNLTVHEINQIPQGEYKDSWPVSLKQFIAMARRLRLPIADQPVPTGAPIPENLRHALVRGMSPKKMHEVTRLAAVVAEACQRAGVDCVVDMGCGLGYLCEALHFMFGFRVVGLESDPDKVARARERHANVCRMLRVEDETGVRYVECDVTDNTEPVARALSQERDASGRPAPFCLIGLHSCGDLTPHAVHMFHRIDQIALFVLVTCCYHKMDVDEGGERAAHCRARAARPTPAAPETDWADRDRAVRSRVVERGRKATLVLQWLLQWGRTEPTRGPGLDPDPEAQAQAQPSPLLDRRVSEEDLYGDEEQRAALSAVLLQWLGPSGTLLAPRAAPAPEHFFKFPLSQELRALAECGPAAAAARLPPAGLGSSRTRGRGASARSLSAACARLTGCCGELPRRRAAARVRARSESCTRDKQGARDLAGVGGAQDDAAVHLDRDDGGAGSEGLWGCQFLRRPLLRLASNETAVSWKCRTGPVHLSHSIHLMTRAVFQLYATQNKLTLAQRGACLLNNMQLGMTPREILADVVDRLLPSLPEAERLHHKKSVAFLYAALDPLRPLLEAVTALQIALQHVCEGLILVDRLAALSEDVPKVSILRVADPYYSPRCYALVAEKQLDRGSHRQ